MASKSKKKSKKSKEKSEEVKEPSGSSEEIKEKSGSSEEPEKGSSKSKSSSASKSGSSEEVKESSKSEDASKVSKSKSGSKSKSESKSTSKSESKSKSGSESDDDKKKSKSKSSSKSGSGSSSSEELVQIDTDKYVPRGPSEPIQEGYDDCFGKYPDPDVTECRRCLENENCTAVYKAKQKDEGKKVKSKKKDKKEKEKDKKESKSKSESKSESKSSEETKKKGPVADTVQAILDESKFEKRGGKLKAGRVKAYIFINKKKALKIVKSKDEDKFKVQLKTKLEPKAFDLKNDKFKKKDSDTWEFTGGTKKLGGYLEAYFKNFEKASKEAKKKSDD